MRRAVAHLGNPFRSYHLVIHNIMKVQAAQSTGHTTEFRTRRIGCELYLVSTEYLVWPQTRSR